MVGEYVRAERFVAGLLKLADVSVVRPSADSAVGLCKGLVSRRLADTESWPCFGPLGRAPLNRWIARHRERR
jgi:hypothetical protein